MPWVTNEDGSLKVENGAPVAIIGDKETPFDVDKYLESSSELRNEAKSKRERAEELESRLAGMVDKTEHEKLTAELAKLKKSAKGKEERTGEPDPEMVEQIEALTAKLENLEGNLSEREQAIAERDNAIFKLQVEREFYSDGHFSASGDSKALTVLPPAVAFKAYGDHFRVEGGKLVAYKQPVPRTGDVNGATVIRSTKPETNGDHAGFNEAIAWIINNDPAKKDILRSSGAAGGDGGGADETSVDGIKTVARAVFDKWSATRKAKHLKDGGKVID